MKRHCWWDLITFHSRPQLSLSGAFIIFTLFFKKKKAKQLLYLSVPKLYSQTNLFFKPLSHHAHSSQSLGTAVLNGTVVRATQEVKRNRVVHRREEGACSSGCLQPRAASSSSSTTFSSSPFVAPLTYSGSFLTLAYPPHSSTAD